MKILNDIRNSLIFISRTIDAEWCHLLDESNMVDIVSTLKVDADDIQDISNYYDTFNGTIYGIGGGNVMDTAKLVGHSLGLPVICIPTTSGTGAECTSFAVVYSNGVKSSIPVARPKWILVPELARSVPKKVAIPILMDALAQCMESYVAIGATTVSKLFAVVGFNKIIGGLFIDKEGSHDSISICNPDEIYAGAHYSGLAINISKTAAPHALSYYLTDAYDLSHGAAIAVSFPLWYMQYRPLLHEDMVLWCDKYLKLLVLSIIPEGIYDRINYKEWAESVNKERMSNSPVQFGDLQYALRKCKFFMELM